MEGDDGRDEHGVPVMADSKERIRRFKKTILLRWHPAFVEILEHINGEYLINFDNVR